MEVGSELTILHPPTGRKPSSGVQAMVEKILKILITQVEIMNMIRTELEKILLIYLPVLMKVVLGQANIYI